MRLIPGDIELKQKQGTRISDLINSFIKQQETRDQIDNRKYKDTRFNRNVGGRQTGTKRQEYIPKSR